MKGQERLHDKYGRFTKGEGKNPTPEERFWNKIVPLETGCLQWTGYCNKDSYGLFKLQGKMILAHRYAWELEHGPIPEGLQIDHLCRNPGCQNTLHMQLVTLAENLKRGYASTSHKKPEERYLEPPGYLPEA